jgi:hypothetical protein
MPGYTYTQMMQGMSGIPGGAGNIAAAQMRKAGVDGNAQVQGHGLMSVVSGIKDWMGQKNAAQIGANPYQGQWDALIAQLNQQANGQGPSLAGNAYKQAHQTGMQSVLAMSRGGSAGAARQGVQTLGRMNQGLAQGYSNARLQEQLAARQQLQNALAGAGNAWFQPQQANLQAQMGAQSNGQSLLGTVAQLAPVAGMIFGGPAGAAAGAAIAKGVGGGGGGGAVNFGQYNRNTGPITSPSQV